MNRKMELDLSREMCHVCDGPLTKDIETEIEKCMRLGCLVRGVPFSIPYKEKKE